MASLLVAIRLTASVALAALLLLIVLGLANGRINAHHLFSRRSKNGTAIFTPDRVQMFVATLVVAALYLSKLPSARAKSELPSIPDAWLAALAASHALYLTVKANRFSRMSERDDQ